MNIRVVPYNPEWPAAYEHEAATIARILGNELVAIYHIGSTSVPGLAAKPVIDIMPTVRSIEAIDRFDASFEVLGYECMGEFGIPGRRYYRKGGEERTHQVHIFGRNTVRDIERHLAFRDYLRAHPATAHRYGELKKSLARRFPDDIEGYCDGKEVFMQELERAALTWYRCGKGIL